MKLSALAIGLVCLLGCKPDNSQRIEELSKKLDAIQSAQMMMFTNQMLIFNEVRLQGSNAQWSVYTFHTNAIHAMEGQEDDIEAYVLKAIKRSHDEQMTYLTNATFTVLETQEKVLDLHKHMWDEISKERPKP